MGSAAPSRSGKPPGTFVHTQSLRDRPDTFAEHELIYMSATSFVRPSYIIQHQNFKVVYSTGEEAKPHSLQQLQTSHSVHSLASPCSTDLAMSLESTSNSMPNGGQISINHGAQAMTKQQWENLKPLIEQIYIEENRPFPYLAEVLRKDHGFELK